MRNQLFAGLAASLILLSIFGSARPAMAQQTNASIARLLQENHVPAAGIGIIRNRRLQQIQVFGELRKGQPAPYDTVFNVASLTKPIVSMLTLRLVTAGEWQLDEPLANYWVDPDVAADPRHRLLTTRHVLSHQPASRTGAGCIPPRSSRSNSSPAPRSNTPAKASNTCARPSSESSTNPSPSSPANACSSLSA